MWRCVCDAPRCLSRRCAQVFAHVQGTDEGIRPKPAPDVILAALEKAERRDGGGGGGDGGGAVFYVGDTERDVLAARAAGARPISVCQTAARDEVSRRVVVGERGRAAPRRVAQARRGRRRRRRRRRQVQGWLTRCAYAAASAVQGGGRRPPLDDEEADESTHPSNETVPSARGEVARWAPDAIAESIGDVPAAVERLLRQ